MNNSNHTLRFSRTYREATGMNANFDDAVNWDRVVGVVGVIALAFVVGMLVGGA